jgi:hypothetical protein
MKEWRRVTMGNNKEIHLSEIINLEDREVNDLRERMKTRLEYGGHYKHL